MPRSVSYFSVFVAVVVSGIFGSARLLAQESDQLFEEFIAPRVRQVKAAGGTRQALNLAGELLETASRPETDAAFGIRLLGTVDELAANLEEGRPLAIRAAKLLADRYPSEADTAYDRLITLRQAQLGATDNDDRTRAASLFIEDLRGAANHQLTVQDDIAAAERYLRQAQALARSHRLEVQGELTDRINSLQARRRIEQRIDRLESQLANNPSDEGLRRRIVLAHVTELNRPTRSLPLLGELGDADLARHARSAAQPIGDLGPDEAMELGRWYRGLADSSSDTTAKAFLLDRARAYYTYFLDRADGAGSETARITLLIQSITDQIGSLGEAYTIQSAQTLPIWTVVFESRNPLDWNPATAPDNMRYVRLRRTDTDEYVLIRARHEQFSSVIEHENYIWNGTNRVARGVHYLGIANKSWRNPYRQGSHIVQVTDHKDGYGGWGFGRRSLVGSDQVQMWNNETIDSENMVTMQISVTAGPLTTEQRRHLLD